MMMVMFLMMAVGIAVVVALGFFALNLSTEAVKRKRQEEDFGYDVVEKAKRGRVMLTDDGELIEISDYEAQVDEQREQTY